MTEQGICEFGLWHWVCGDCGAMVGHGCPLDTEDDMCLGRELEEPDQTARGLTLSDSPERVGAQPKGTDTDQKEDEDAKRDG